MWIFGYGSLVWKADFPYVKRIVGYVEGYERRFWQASIDHRGVPGKPGRVVTLAPTADPNARVWGTAYKIHRRDIESVIRQLDLREITGYERVPVEFNAILNHPMNTFSRRSQYSGKNQEILYANSDCDSDGSTTSSVSDENDIQDYSDFDLSESEDEDYEDESRHQMIVTMYYGSEANEHFMGPAPLEEMAQQIFECSGHSGRNRDYLYNLTISMREICEEAVDPHLRSLDKAVRDLESGKMAILKESRTHHQHYQLKSKALSF